MTTLNDYQSCIDTCNNCASACNHCAASCTREEDVEMMAKCIRLDMECAALCTATATLMSLGSDKSKELCRICADLCIECAEECEKHHHDHCLQCAAACRECASQCQIMSAAKY